MKKKSALEVYQLKRDLSGEYERLSQSGEIDLYYGDQASAALEPNVPYGWQFDDEEVSMLSEKGTGINCFGLFTRSLKSWTATSEETIDAAFVVEQLERFSFSLSKLTVVVLDNARIDTGKKMRQRIGAWRAARIVHLLSANIFTAFEHCGNTLAQIEIRMVGGGRLRVERTSAICR